MKGSKKRYIILTKDAAGIFDLTEADGAPSFAALALYYQKLQESVNVSSEKRNPAFRCHQLR